MHLRRKSVPIQKVKRKDFGKFKDRFFLYQGEAAFLAKNSCFNSIYTTSASTCVLLLALPKDFSSSPFLAHISKVNRKACSKLLQVLESSCFKEIVLFGGSSIILEKLEFLLKQNGFSNIRIILKEDKDKMRFLELFSNGLHTLGSKTNDFSHENEDINEISERIEKAKKEGMVLYSPT